MNKGYIVGFLKEHDTITKEIDTQKVTIQRNQNIKFISKSFMFHVKKDVMFNIKEKRVDDKTFYCIDDNNFDIHFNCDYLYDCVPTYCEYICDELKEIAMEDDDYLKRCVKYGEMNIKLIGYIGEIDEPSQEDLGYEKIEYEHYE